ncbi:recombinase family protein [Microvirga aerilata]|uniref:Recombinase family protein n=1 Tax=Microvirga aerilata TaxID=670292 RepID=A0A936ZD53_9HYPH|nr:recombinase family protein [Microvirga aerilata]MBL0404644.1 recombinase family protein [Microvirga aerilata]
MPNGHSYYRYSSAIQGQGDSIRRQSSLVEKVAAEKGIPLIRSYADYGLSAYRGDNSKFGMLARFKQDVKDGLIPRGDWLFVESLDRLSRDRISEAQKVLEDLLLEDIVICTVADRRVYTKASLDEPLQIIGAILIMSRAHEEAQMKSFRASEAWAERHRNQEKGEICPGWLYLDGEVYQPIPYRVQFVVIMFEMAARGIGASAIADDLNERGIPPFSAEEVKVNNRVKVRTGKKAERWGPSSVRNILINRAVLGEYQPRTEVEKEITKIVDGKEARVKVREKEPAGDPILEFYPQIISANLWQQVERARRRNKARAKGGALGKTYANLFRDIAVCSRCRGPMIVPYSDSKNPQRATLVCANANRKHKCKRRTYFKKELVETAILDHVKEYRLSEIFRDPDKEKALQSAENEIAEITLKLERLEKESAKLLKLIRESEDDDETQFYRTDVKEMLATKKAALARRDYLKGERVTLIANRDTRRDAEAVVTKLRSDLNRLDERIRETYEEVEKSKLQRYQFAIRSKLSAALHAFVGSIEFDPDDMTIIVFIDGDRIPEGRCGYLFRQTERRGRWQVRDIEFVRRVQIPITRYHFWPENVQPLSELIQLQSSKIYSTGAGDDMKG